MEEGANGIAAYNEEDFDLEQMVLRRADPDDCD